MSNLESSLRNELLVDIRVPFENTMFDLSANFNEIIKNRILSILDFNQQLHNSRAAYVNHIKNSLFAKKPKIIDALNYLSFIAMINEGVIHDIDNRKSRKFYCYFF